MRQLRVEVDASAHLPLVLPIEVAEGILVLALAGAEHGNLDRAVEQLTQCVLDQVAALLLGKATHHDGERTARVNLEAELLLQHRLASGLAGEVVHGVVAGNARVNPGVVLLRVDAVQDAMELPGAIAEDVIEPLAIERGLELLGVSRAHRGDGVRVEERPLHEVDGLRGRVHLAGSGGIRQAADVAHDLVAILAWNFTLWIENTVLTLSYPGRPL